MTVNAFRNDQLTTASFIVKAKRTAGSSLSRNEVKKAEGNYDETHENNGGKGGGAFSCLRADQMPVEMREPFILTGYRPPNLSTHDYLLSAFSHNNECMNIWTHFLWAVFMMLRYLSLSWSHRPLDDPMLYPLTAFALGTSSLYLISAGAHALNSCSLRFQHVCFFFDYAAISIYTFAAGIAFYAYTRPLHSNLLLYDSPVVFLAFSALISFLATYLCCQTRRKWKRARFIIRTLAYVLPWFYDSSPFLSRLFWFSDADPLSFESQHVFKLCYLSFLVAGVANASRIPERFMPGVFDFFGHSHNLLHVMTALGDQFAFSAYCIDLEERGEELCKSFAPSLWNTIGPTILVLIGNIAIAMWFAWSLMRLTDLSTKYSRKGLCNCTDKYE